MPDLVFTTKGVAQVISDQERLSQSLGKQKTAARELNAEYAANEAELRKLGRTAQQIYLANETAQEKYNRKLAEAKAALQGNVNETELLTREQARLKKELDESNKISSSLFDPKRLIGYAAGFASVQTAVSLITAELRAQQELIDKRNATQLSVGESRNVLLRNLIGSPDKEIRSALAAGKSIAQGTNVSEVPINNALASAISATGNVPLSIELVRRSAQFLQDRPGEIGDFAGALGDLTRMTHSNDPNIALGLLAQIGRITRITSPQQTARSVAPALLGTLPFGGTAQSAGAVFAALTTGSGDVEGMHSGTGTIALAQQLEEAALGKGGFAPTSSHPGFDPGELKGANLLERLRFLQQNPAAAQKFLDLASFERKVVGQITQLLIDPRSDVRRDFETAMSSIGDNRSLLTQGRSANSIFGYNEFEPVASRSRTINRLVESLQTRRASERLTTSDLESLRNVALETGSPSIVADVEKWTGVLKGGGTVTTQEAISQLNARAAKLENPTELSGMAAAFGRTEIVARPSTAEEKESAKLLRDAVRSLEQSLKEQQETNRILRRPQTGQTGLRVGGS